MPLTLSQIEDLQEESFAQDLDILDEMGSWAEQEVREYFESGGFKKPSGSLSVKERWESQSPLPRGAAIAESVASKQTAAELRAKEAVAKRTALAGKENAKVVQAVEDNKAFQENIRLATQEGVQARLALAKTNRQQHIDNRKDTAAAEALKVKTAVSLEKQMSQAEAAIKEIRLNDRLAAAAERKESILEARREKAAALGAPAAAAALENDSITETSKGSCPPNDVPSKTWCKHGIAACAIVIAAFAVHQCLLD